MIVLDASLAIKLFVEEPGTDATRTLVAGGAHVVVPDLFVCEIANIIWKKSAANQIVAKQAELIGSEIDLLVSETVGCRHLFDDAVRIALTMHHPAYDCFYLALAVQRGIRLYTADKRLTKRVEGTVYADAIVLIEG